MDLLSGPVRLGPIHHCSLGSSIHSLSSAYWFRGGIRLRLYGILGQFHARKALWYHLTIQQYKQPGTQDSHSAQLFLQTLSAAAECLFRETLYYCIGRHTYVPSPAALH